MRFLIGRVVGIHRGEPRHGPCLHCISNAIIVTVTLACGARALWPGPEGNAAMKPRHTLLVAAAAVGALAVAACHKTQTDNNAAAAGDNSAAANAAAANAPATNAPDANAMAPATNAPPTNDTNNPDSGSQGGNNPH